MSLSVPARRPHSIVTLLGGKQVLPHPPKTSLEWVEVIRKGISSAALEALAKSVEITQTELANALGIPDRTLARRKKEGAMSSDETAKLIRLARVVERAEQVFGDLETGLDWLKTPNASMARARPISLLDTDIGTESVMDTLGRIEHGVFA